MSFNFFYFIIFFLRIFKVAEIVYFVKKRINCPYCTVLYINIDFKQFIKVYGCQYLQFTLTLTLILTLTLTFQLIKVYAGDFIKL